MAACFRQLLLPSVVLAEGQVLHGKILPSEETGLASLQEWEPFLVRRPVPVSYRAFVEELAAVVVQPGGEQGPCAGAWVTSVSQEWVEPAGNRLQAQIKGKNAHISLSDNGEQVTRLPQS